MTASLLEEGLDARVEALKEFLRATSERVFEHSFEDLSEEEFLFASEARACLRELERGSRVCAPYSFLKGLLGAVQEEYERGKADVDSVEGHLKLARILLAREWLESQLGLLLVK